MDFIWNHLNAIEDADIKQMAIFNYKRQLKLDAVNGVELLRTRRRRLASNIGYAIDFAFSWSVTPQGHEFWRNVATTYGRYDD